MTNARAIINPFNKNESRMKRDSHGLWRSTNDESTPPQPEPGPSKADQLVTPQSHHFSHAAGPEIARVQSQLPQTSAAIHNAEDLYDLPDTHMRLPSVRSWSSFRSSRYDDEEISSKTITRTSTPSSHAAASPLYRNSAARRNSPASAIVPADFSQEEETRKESNATVFPHYPCTIKKPEPRPKKSEAPLARVPLKSSAPPAQGKQEPWKLADLYRNAQSIHRTGPKGEGQKLWAGYKQFRKQTQTHPGIAQDKGKQKQPNIQSNQGQSSVGLSAHPPLRPQPAHIPRALDVAREQSYARKGSADTEGGVSLSSCEVPVRIDAGMQRATDRRKPLPHVPRQVVDTNKPLPTVPMLLPAPKSRKYNDQNRPRPAQTKTSKEQQLKPNEGEWLPWWKVLSVKMPDIEVPTFHQEDSDADKLKAHQKLKSKISRPTLLSPNKLSTTNLSVRQGGVGGPGTHVSRPPVNFDRFTARQKGKQKAKDDAPTKHWKDILNNPLSKQGVAADRRRKSSDATFGCVGVEDSDKLYFHKPGPSRQFDRYQVHSAADTDEGELRPEPLFWGMRNGREIPRDTRFFQPYHDVLGEYQDGRGGRV